MVARTPSGSAHNPLTTAFRGQAAVPTVRALRAHSLSITEVVSDQRDLVVTGTVPMDDAYVVTLHLRRRPRGAMNAEGRWLDPRDFHAGHAGIVDLRMKLLSEYAGPFHYISFYLPQRTLDAFADDAEVPRVTELQHRLGVGFSDPVIWHLLSSVRPALAAEAAEVPPLYTEHVARAIVAHVATTYGGLQLPTMAARGGLTPAQERRAKELLESRLAGAVTLAELASACRISVRHFTRAFRETTGQSPHQWLTERRLDKARVLLDRSDHSLDAIARSCGFASQSHLTRVFTRAMGTSPGAWRRLRR